VLGILAQLLVWWEVQVARPVDDLAVGLVVVLGAERGPADQALEHDGSDTPPITSEIVALAGKDLGGDVIWSTDSGVCQLSTGLSPSVDLVAVGYGKLDLVDGNAVAVLLLRHGFRFVR
jgi:hypothetical protein